MWNGCIVFLLVFFVAFGIEWVMLPQAAEPYRWQFSIALAFVVTLVVSNLWGLWHAVGRMRLARKDPSRWQEGELIAISGEVRPLRRGVQAPVSDTDVAMYEFQAVRRTSNSKNSSSNQVVELHSYGMAACGIYSGSGVVRVIGFPKLQSFPSKSFASDTDRQRAARYIAERQWTQRATSFNAVLEQLQGGAAQDSTEEHFARAGCTVPAEILPNNQPPAVPHAREARPDAVARIAAALREQAIILRETVVETGCTVSAFGVYRTNLMGIEVSGPGLDVHCAVFPGPLGKVVGGLVWKALLTLLVMGGLATAAHYVAFVRNGELLRQVAGFLAE